MKRITALLFVFALLLVIVAPTGFGVNTQSVNISSQSSIWADGGGPAPPFPNMPPSASPIFLWADGGGPAPPFPNMPPSLTVSI
ncbi:MAG: hypothetical protein ACHP8A_08430 [Terriglobales bacterium]